MSIGDSEPSKQALLREYDDFPFDVPQREIIKMAVASMSSREVREAINEIREIKRMLDQREQNGPAYLAALNRAVMNAE